MNREELEGALQIVNHNLLTENEFSYMYHVSSSEMIVVAFKWRKIIFLVIGMLSTHLYV